MSADDLFPYSRIVTVVFFALGFSFAAYASISIALLFFEKKRLARSNVTDFTTCIILMIHCASAIASSCMKVISPSSKGTFGVLVILALVLA
jgi:hypothetical protein